MIDGATKDAFKSSRNVTRKTTEATDLNIDGPDTLEQFCGCKMQVSAF
jgi:hypothetical protein